MVVSPMTGNYNAPQAQAGVLRLGYAGFDSAMANALTAFQPSLSANPAFAQCMANAINAFQVGGQLSSFTPVAVPQQQQQQPQPEPSPAPMDDCYTAPDRDDDGAQYEAGYSSAKETFGQYCHASRSHHCHHGHHGHRSAGDQQSVGNQASFGSQPSLGGPVANAGYGRGGNPSTFGDPRSVGFGGANGFGGVNGFGPGYGFPIPLGFPPRINFASLPPEASGAYLGLSLGAFNLASQVRTFGGGTFLGVDGTGSAYIGLGFN